MIIPMRKEYSINNAGWKQELNHHMGQLILIILIKLSLSLHHVEPNVERCQTECQTASVSSTFNFQL